MGATPEPSLLSIDAEISTSQLKFYTHVCRHTQCTWLWCGGSCDVHRKEIHPLSLGGAVFWFILFESDPMTKDMGTPLGQPLEFTKLCPGVSFALQHRYR